MNVLNKTELDLPPLYSFQEQLILYSYVIAILLGTMIATIGTLIKIPQQITAFICGAVIGLIAIYAGRFDDFNLDPNLLFSIYVPLVIIKICYNMDNYLVVKSLSQILLISVIGNTAFMLLFGLMIQFFQNDKVIYLHVMLVAIILAPNECPEMPNLDGIKNLETLMYGESIFGIALCTTGYTVAIAVSRGYVTQWYQIASQLVRYIGLSIPIGYCFGWIASAIFGRLYNDPINAVTVIFAADYFTYSFCEHILYCNGTLAAFITLNYVTAERTRLLSRTDHNIKLCIYVGYSFMQTMLVVYSMAKIICLWNFDNLIMQVVEAFSIYTIGNVLRFIFFLIQSPILSRIGYGFDFTGLVTIFWVVYKGPLQLLQVIKICVYDEDLYILDKLVHYTLFFVMFTYLINGTTLEVFLKRFGLMKLSSRKKANVSIGINTMNEAGATMLAMVKMNRFYSDANWGVIYAQTALVNPFEEFAQGQSAWAKETVVCNVCNTNIPLQPSKVEYEEHFKDVALRVLKAQRVSFIKQHESGYLSKEDVVHLLQAVERAMDSADMIIKLDHLYSTVDERYTTHMKKILRFIAGEHITKIPKSKPRRRCYNVIESIYFEVFIHVIVVIDFIFIILRLTDKIRLYLREIDFFGIIVPCLSIYIIEAILKLSSIESEHKCTCFKTYMRNRWNQIDFMVLLICSADVILCVLVQLDILPTNVTKYEGFFKLLIGLKLLRIYVKLYPFLVAYTERKNERKLMHVFVISMGLIISCEEVINILPTLTEQANIREMIKANLLVTRTNITQQLGVLEKQRPSLTTTIKSATALRSILKHIQEAIVELKSSGLIDSFEFNKLSYSINIKQKYLDKLKVLEIVQPKIIFNEIYWLYNDEYLSEYIYENVKTKIFNAGDILCNKGDNPDGVYIIVAGYFKVTYYPCPEQLLKLKQNGELPIKEFLEYMRFGEIQEDYLSCANRMGELAVLTNRPYSCSIASEAPSQAFIIPRDILENAMKLSPDPVLGLAARIWKSTLLALGRRLLLNTSAYQSASADQVNYSLNRAIVPNTDYYSIIVLTQAVEDVILVQGIVVDFNTRDIFIAPCALPRQVTKLIMPKDPEAKTNKGTKLMFIPASNVDEYEMMFQIERSSELIAGHASVMLSNQKRSMAKRFMQYHIFSMRKTTGAPYYSNKMLPNYSVNYKRDRNSSKSPSTKSNEPTFA